MKHARLYAGLGACVWGWVGGCVHACSPLLCMHLPVLPRFSLLSPPLLPDPLVVYVRGCDGARVCMWARACASTPFSFSAQASLGFCTSILIWISSFEYHLAALLSLDAF